MAIYSRYSKVVEADGTPLRVRAALQFINQIRSEVEGEDDSEYDAGTQWAIKWFEWFGWNAGPYGDAETLSKSKNMTVTNLKHVGLVISEAGKVQLRARADLPKIGNLRMRKDLTTWEVMQRMIQELLYGNTEVGAAHILRQATEHTDMIQTLTYRLFTLCERKKMATEAMPYNSLATSWPEITRLAYRENEEPPEQATMF
jgi:putative DNA methylase